MIPTQLLAATLAGATLGAGAFVVTPSLAADAPGDAAADSHHRGLALGHARRVIHATWTTRDGEDHRAIRGTVRAVSARTITVRAKDGVTQTYVVTDTTKVRVADGDKSDTDTISEVEVGDQALVVGSGSDARHVLARRPGHSTGSES